ncbi:MAG: hypothetical protein JWN61_58, partial [Pseudonocardiales bacterium]|nr:hypothetical protein [Pseudonocardiales bacterium]
IQLGLLRGSRLRARRVAAPRDAGVGLVVFDSAGTELSKHMPAYPSRLRQASTACSSASSPAWPTQAGQRAIAGFVGKGDTAVS